QKLTQAATTRSYAGAATALFERAAQVAHGDVHGWSQAEDHAGEQRDARSECQYAQVKLNARQVWQHFRSDLFQQLDAPHCEQQPASPTCEREQEAFNEHLSHQPETASTECGSNSDLFAASG